MRRVITILIVVLLSTIVAQGQIRIGGNVYGGGNHAEVKGSTKVTVKAGDIGAVLDPNAERPLEDPQGKVFGGARMANVGGNTFVHIDGKSDLTGDLATKSNYILINQVFGGNDIAGQIGTAAAVGEQMPTELTAVKKTEADQNDPKKNAVDNTFNSYVLVSTKATDQHYTAEEIAEAASDPENAAYGKSTSDVKPDPNARKVYIGQLFAGGNGDFDYEQTPLEDGKVRHTIYNRSDKNHMTPLAEMETNEGEVGFHLPELDKTYMEVVGGSIVYAYGGGNNATVKEKTIIHIDNPSAVVNHIYVNKDTWAEDLTATAESNTKDLLCTERFKEMGINTGFSKPSSGAYQVGRFFGGNNKAEMHIRPTWNLLAGKVRNLYSGGNQGNMTSPEGLLLEIKDYSTLIVDNLYGGCRMADVMPTVNGVYVPCTNLQDKDKDGNLLYKFPDELSARVLVRGGYIHNIYGGNDVTGTVYGGNALGIYTTVHGDVYGGGNGSYPYTDNDHTYKDDDVYGDFLYSTDGYSSSVEALNAFRPNAEQVSIHLKGTDTDHPTIIKGSVFVGGNCASLATKKENPLVELKIGSHVWVDKVFLGNNGEGMIDDVTLQHYAGVYPGAGGFSSINYMKTNASAFADYMDGVTMYLQPSIAFDSKANGDPDDYIDYTSKIGSFYCGGNVGSMAIAGKNTYRVDRGLVIFEKFVAGCNNANVEEGDYNAAYEGGILGAQNERGGAANEYYTDNGTATGKIKDRIELNLNNVVIEPRRWNDTFEPITAADIENDKLKAGQEYYTTDLRLSKFIADGTESASISATDKYYKLTVKGNQLDWNTAKWSTDEDDFMATNSTNTADDKVRRLLGGNVYGGCYNSGHVNGNVVININQDLIKRDVVFAEADSDDPYKVKDGGDRRSGVLREAQGDDTQAVAMTVFGAGYGENTEIWGSTTVNLNNGYAFQIFGGGEEGVVGKRNTSGEYVYNAAYSSTVNMKGANAGYSEKESGLPLAETEYIYGGGNEGDVLGDTYVYLGNGRVYDAFGGASNADIYGGTEVYIGHNGGYPWIRDNVYGGNDFGGNIKGKRNHTTAITKDAFDASMLQSSTYVKYLQGRVDSIFGGCYGSYDYTDPVFKDYTYSKGETGIPSGKSPGSPRLDENNEPVFSFPHMDNNSFVHFTPEENANNKVGFIFGGSEGFPGHVELNNTMQKECYVHVHDTKTKDANRFANVDIYGGGAFAGTGILGNSPENTYYGAGRTAIDLYGGSFHNVYGGCNQEGLVGYTRVNVPSGSTVKVNALFGGGKGYSTDLIAETPALAARYCDHYVTCIDYQSEDAIVNDAIYGGNENCRISVDTYINIGAPVMQSSGYQATIYGAGYGKKTVSGRTNVFMNNNSNAYKVFGGGRDGNAFNFVSLRQWLTNQLTAAGTAAGDMSSKLSEYNHLLLNFGTYLAANPITLPAKTGTYVNASTGEYEGTYTNDLLPTTEKPTPTYHQTNVHIMNGGNVSGYAYGGGLGTDAVVAGSTYVELKGGNVDRDIYGGGQGGPVFDEFGLGTNVFTATTNVYIEGGMARNVYGGGYLGHVGKHCKTVDGKIVEAAIHETDVVDIPAIANVTIGKVDGTSFYNGIPAITRNVYGGGEGGSVYGTANLTINNGYIGYRYKNTATSGPSNFEYVEELDDQKTNDIELAGNVFGGGYVVNSYVDKTNVEMYGGTIRGSLYGGGEVGPIGRGTIRYKDTYDTGLVNGNARIFKAGKSHVKMYNGLIKRNVFGGGRGKDSWGGDGTLYMDEDLKPTLDLQCKGYVFGQTEVDIYGGEVGTDEGVAQGFGNVFGGGDEGSVYSALEVNGTLHIGHKEGERYKDDTQGYYFLHNGTNYILKTNDEYTFTEDCKVLVEPWLQVKNTSISYDPDGDGPENSKTYKVGDYIPTSYLNTLKAKVGENWPSEWANLDVGTATDNGFKERGVIIHNAVFAGGNIASGSSAMYANEKTVFGNATASIHDVYNRDFITIGTGHTGGLYGDGNLTFVDGYRELNITNYGSDYYHIARTLSYNDYLNLPKREQDYYEVKYTCIAEQGCTDRDGTTYKKEASLPKDELIALFTKDDGTSVMNNEEGSLVTEGSGGTAVLTGTTIGQLEPNPVIWRQDGVVSTYAGRIMNTIQRADLCGVFGSRMVMKGARDRVPETVDYTNYTINRVREVSLNKKDSPAGDTDDDNKMHGNYFGIYSIVNYLGSLTSDVDFQSLRTTKAGGDLAATNGETFEQWKEAHKTDRKRNNGNCHNQMALASGVYLELTTEQSTGSTVDKKDWGLITGVVELDLINVQAGIGGGFVYAKNEHGYRTRSGKTTTTLTKLNEHAVTKWDFDYSTTDVAWAGGESTTGKKEWQTSGNFIHSSQTIIDDCYNESNRYLGEGKVKAHYWFISGQVYVYDQVISAYTGSPNAFSETVEIPITINAASNGTMTLVDVKPNLYAFYSSYTNSTTFSKLGGDKKLVINDVTYQLNDPISYWDWNKLPQSEKNLFVEKTYILKDSCYINSQYYPAGYVMSSSEYTELKGHAVDHEVDGKTVKAVKKATKNAAGDPVVEKDKDNQDVYVAFTDAFRLSNNISHNKGYILTYNVNNPTVWDKWYTKVEDDVVSGEQGDEYVLVKKQTSDTGFEDGPTYYPTESGLYGQQRYAKNDIIPQKTYTDYTSALTQLSQSPTGQATFTGAHLVTSECTSGGIHYYPGAAVSAAISGYTSPAYVCTSTIKLSDAEYIYINELMTESQKTTYYNRFNKEGATDAEKLLAADIDKFIVPAYICTGAGLYGGNYYLSNKNYRALEAWSSMSETDRQSFEFNYDALDLLVDSTYTGTKSMKYQYDGKGFKTAEEAATNPATYSLKTPIDYKATYNGETDTQAHNGITRTNGVEYTRVQYESLPNEQRHYAPILVTAAGTIYVVKTDFVHVETPYAAGTIISSEEFDRLTGDEKKNVTALTFTASDFSDTGTTYYYCREEYKIGEKDEGVEPTPVSISGASGGIVTKTDGKWVTAGTIIKAVSDDDDVIGYAALPNYQKNFTIHGVSPTETSTLYVGRNADINDLSTEKIITVIYKYDYEESDADGMHITPVSERHVVNIHIKFKSGVPVVEDIQEPSIVLPGTSLTMRVPNVTEGAYDVLGGGWELFDTPANAESHTNGVDYKMLNDSLYWYQDGYYLAYYAKTYLGKTYSNHVPVHVANYHDLKKVMDDKKHHLHVDYDRSLLKRDSKIYINDYSSHSQNGLDLFKNFYDLSLLTDPSTDSKTGLIKSGSFIGHKPLNTNETNGVKAGHNLQFILRTDLTHEDNPAVANEWTSIASGENDPCFNGTLHGDGHTISGLDNSLFGKLCGSVYNLGVTGSFTSAGVADSGDGYVESCWVKTSSSADLSVSGIKAVFGGSSSVSQHEQTVNCYYPESNSYATGKAIQKSDQAFYNGEVAYDLNNFYLYKRYSDKQVSAGVEYKYWKPGETTPKTGHYAENAGHCSSGYNGIKYVEERFADGDFRYAGGTIPTETDERLYTDTEDNNKEKFFPIWPDDYIFFGQKLTYGWAVEAHQNVPTAIVKSNGRLSQLADANRVYRAPAYYGSSTMGVAHFNPQVYLAQKEKNGSRDAYPGMTAIDFAGHNDTHNEANGANMPYELGLNAAGKFYAPLLDDGGLTGITNYDETQNLLVYAPAETAASEGSYANKATYDVLNSYFVDPDYSDYYTANDYRTVADATSVTSSIYGHLVLDGKIAKSDHLLVDKQDFNCPIAYKFDSSHRMWYQRKPEDQEFVDHTKGWQGISIPFTAELVTTNEKGEITHFYEGSATSANSDSKIGHEYWLRELNDLTEETVTINNTPTLVAKGSFLYPKNSTGSKNYTNTFLWDYYYKNTELHDQKDRNSDIYQTYYNSSHNYSGYPLLAAATPYIIGFPGQTYYEFDLSGNFKADNTSVSIPELGKQLVTFASNTGITIEVSDDENKDVTKTLEGTNKNFTFTFHRNYRTQNLGTSAYTLNSDGSRYDKVTDEGGSAVSGGATSIPFRPYFTASSVAKSAGARQMMPEYIYFGGDFNGLEEETTTILNGGLEIYAKNHKIITTSHLKSPVTITIVNVSGITYANYVLQPGETQETRVQNSGVYIVNRKKLLVR